jgi:hypothetical protein
MQMREAMGGNAKDDNKLVQVTAEMRRQLEKVTSVRSTLNSVQIEA